jgi:hypothetical protein
MLLAIGKSGAVDIVSEPRKMMALANGLAVAGLPKVIEMLKDGDGEPIWNISDAIDGISRKEKVAQFRVSKNKNTKKTRESGASCAH